MIVARKSIHDIDVCSVEEKLTTLQENQQPINPDDRIGFISFSKNDEILIQRAGDYFELFYNNSFFNQSYLSNYIGEVHFLDDHIHLIIREKPFIAFAAIGFYIIFIVILAIGIFSDGLSVFMFMLFFVVGWLQKRKVEKRFLRILEGIVNSCEL